MICPNCQVPTQEVKVPSANPGYFVKIDQCPDCGGIWCDRFEMYQIPASQADKIDILNQKLLLSNTPLKDSLKCPKDNSPLVEIKDPSIPSNTKIKRCRKCEGVWLNHGDLSHYKRHVQVKQNLNAFLGKKIWKIGPHSKDWSESDETRNRVMAKISLQLMPLPLGYATKILSPHIGGQDLSDPPFSLSDGAVEIIKKLPQDKKIEVIKTMAQEHENNIESENRFINATTTILNIISGLIRK